MRHITDYQEVMDALHSGENIFITGAGGTGKTHIIKEYFKSSNNAALTTTTGVAAINIGGETIHRFLGLGISSRDFEAGKIIGKWMRMKKSSRPWEKDKWNTIENTNTIIIDEVSMLRRDQFELIDMVLSAIKDNPLPFGGIQTVLVGDLFQLPPIVTNYEIIKYPDLNQPFCFQSPLWNQAGFQSFNLCTNYRQGEGEFLDALENIRIGKITDDVRNILESRLNVDLQIPMEPVKLFSHKKDVRIENINILKKLPGDKLLSTAEFTGKKYHTDILKRECPAETDLYFGKDAQVMMLTNTDRWVNGTMGIIKETNPVKIKLSSGEIVIVNPHKWERIEHRVMPNGTISAQTVASMIQYPFKLGYSITVHKSQSLTIDYLDVDISKCFAPGQAYVALSRAKTLEGLRLRGWNENAIKADQRVKSFYGIS